AEAPAASSIDPADMMRQTANGQASYIELEYTANTLDYAKVLLVNVLILTTSCGLLFPWALARSKAHFYRSVRLDGQPFAFKVAAGKSCLIALAVSLLAAAAFSVAAFAPVDNSQWIALGLAATSALLVPFLAF